MLPLSLFCPCLCQNANTMLSLQLPMKFGNVVRVETSRYLTKITTLRRKADREGSCSFATITMCSWWQPGESHARSEFKILEPSPSYPELYIVIVAKPYAWLQEPEVFAISLPQQCRDLCQYREVPPVRYCQISPAFAETALYLPWQRYKQKRERVSRKHTSGKF